MVTNFKPNSKNRQFLKIIKSPIFRGVSFFLTGFLLTTLAFIGSTTEKIAYAQTYTGTTEYIQNKNLVCLDKYNQNLLTEAYNCTKNLYNEAVSLGNNTYQTKLSQNLEIINQRISSNTNTQISFYSPSFSVDEARNANGNCINQYNRAVSINSISDIYNSSECFAQVAYKYRAINNEYYQKATDNNIIVLNDLNSKLKDQNQNCINIFNSAQQNRNQYGFLEAKTCFVNVVSLADKYNPNYANSIRGNISVSQTNYDQFNQNYSYTSNSSYSNYYNSDCGLSYNQCKLRQANKYCVDTVAVYSYSSASTCFSRVYNQYCPNSDPNYCSLVLDNKSKVDTYRSDNNTAKDIAAGAVALAALITIFTN